MKTKLSLFDRLEGSSHCRSLLCASLLATALLLPLCAHSQPSTNGSTVVGWGDNSWGQSLAPAQAANVVAIAADEMYSLALKADGTVVGWGANVNGETSIPESATNVVAIAAGGFHNLALKADGTVIGWGANSAGATTIPESATNLVAIAAGYSHSLALKADGTIVGWGNNSQGQTDSPASATNVVAIAAGDYSSLALKADGTVVGWGQYWIGSSLVPMTVPASATNVVAIAAGGEHSLALKADGTVVGWGLNEYGQATGVPTYPYASTGVVTVAGQTLTNVVAIAAGEWHSLALKADGTVVGWGQNGYGQATGPPAATNVVAIAVGNFHSLALTEVVQPIIWRQPVSQEVYAGQPVWLTVQVVNQSPVSYQWRLNGQDIPGATGSRFQVEAAWLADARSYSVVVSNSYGSVTSQAAVLEFRTIVGWGDNAGGQTNIPASTSNAVAIAAGGVHSLALKADGTVVGWGNNGFGQATGVEFGSPGIVTRAGQTLTNVAAIAAGDTHSLALKADGMVVGWGLNDYGQTDIPASAANVVAITAGSYHSLALKADGTVVGWGAGGPGTSGGDHPHYGQTTIPASATNVVAIAAGGYYSLALKADGMVVGWGQNSFGEATGVEFGSPGIVTNAGQTLTNVVAIAAGNIHSLALKADGTVVGWGWNGYGQTTIPSSAANVVAIASGDGHGLALKADGMIVAWGQYWNGSSNVPMTVPASVTNVVAIAAGNAHSLAMLGPLLDTDGDGLADRDECFVFHTSPFLKDTDGDGMPDGWEIQNRLNPLINDANDDLDLDGVTNLREYQERGSGYLAGRADSLGDGRSDFERLFGFQTNRFYYDKIDRLIGAEYNHGSNGLSIAYVYDGNGNLVRQKHLARDANGNGLPDLWEFLNGLTNNPSAFADSDGDGWSDYQEWKARSNPLDTNSVPGTNVVQTAPIAVVLPSTRLLGNLAIITNRLWDAEGNASTPFLQFQLDGSTNWQDATLMYLDGAPYATNSRVAAPPYGTNHTLVWNALTDLGIHVNTNLLLRTRAQDITLLGNWSGGTPFTVQTTVTPDVELSASSVAENQPSGTMVGTLSRVDAAPPAASFTYTLVSGAGSADNASFMISGSALRTAAVFDYETKPAYSVRVRSTDQDGLWYEKVFPVTVTDVGEPPLAPSNVAPGNGATSQPLTVVLQASAFSDPDPGDTHEASQWVIQRVSDSAVVFESGEDTVNKTSITVPVGALTNSGDYGWQVRYKDNHGEWSPYSVQTTFSTVGCSYSLSPTSTNTPAGAFGGAFAVTTSDGCGWSASTTNDWIHPTGSSGGNGTVNYTVDANTNASPRVGLIMVAGQNFTVNQGGVTPAPPNVIAWGDNADGKTIVPPDLTNAVFIAAGGSHSLAIKADGTIIGWGSNNGGQLSTPSDATNLLAVSAGGSFSLGLRADGHVVGWPSNGGYGQTTVPIDLTNAVAIAAGHLHSLALRADGTVVAWGAGQTNDPSSLVHFGQAIVPPGLGNVVAIAAGYDHSLALKADGTVVGWGTDFLGESTGAVSASNIVAISVGQYSSLALKADGTVMAWGINPAPIGLTNIVAIQAGFIASMGLRADGTVVAWGRDNYGQTNVPAGLKNVSALAGGWYHNLALLGSGAPVITVQPFSRKVTVGDAVTLTGMAVGIQPLSYQWQLNGTNINGATANSYTRTNTLFSDAGIYSVIVTNALGSSVSSNATFTVDALARPVIGIACLSNQSFQLSIPTLPGRIYWIQASTNLSDWETIFGTEATNNSVEFVETGISNHPTRFYRVLLFSSATTAAHPADLNADLFISDSEYTNYQLYYQNHYLWPVTQNIISFEYYANAINIRSFGGNYHLDPSRPTPQCWIAGP